MTIAEMVRDTGFARSTVVIHLERLGTEGLVLRGKKPGGGHGRLRFLYCLTDIPMSKAVAPPSIVAIEFPQLRKACRYKKGGYCKLAENTCTAQNCKPTIKPKIC